MKSSHVKGGLESIKRKGKNLSQDIPELSEIKEMADREAKTNMRRAPHKSMAAKALRPVDFWQDLVSRSTTSPRSSDYLDLVMPSTYGGEHSDFAQDLDASNRHVDITSVAGDDPEILEQLNGSYAIRESVNGPLHDVNVEENLYVTAESGIPIEVMREWPESRERLDSVDGDVVMHQSDEEGVYGFVDVDGDGLGRDKMGVGPDSTAFVIEDYSGNSMVKAVKTGSVGSYREVDTDSLYEAAQDCVPGAQNEGIEAIFRARERE